MTIPKDVLTAVTGVASSGKSSLVCHEFVNHYPEAVGIDQKPVGTSIRSTPATYTGVMDEIRKLFAKENHVGAEWFSFNSKGACPVCEGKGEITYDMAFAEPVVVLCEECQGHRYNPTALSYTYHGKNIEEVDTGNPAAAQHFFKTSLRPCKRQKTRLLVVGGAGSLYINPEHTVQVMDGADFPEIFSPLASNMGKALDELRTRTNVKWTYLSPAGDFQADGIKTGKYILGGEELTLNSKGESVISYADYAFAMVDEALNGNHIQQRISVVAE